MIPHRLFYNEPARRRASTTLFLRRQHPSSNEVAMDFDLPREVRLVRRSVREFAEQTDRAARRGDGAARRVPGAAREGPRRHRRPRPGHARRVRRLEPRTSGAHGGCRGGQSCVGRRGHQPPGPPHGRRRALRFRKRRPEGEVPPRPVSGRLPRHLRHHRADRRFGPSRHGQHGPSRGRRLRAHRPQVLHHQLPSERRGGHRRQDRGGPEGDQRVRSRERDARIQRGPPRAQARTARRRHRAK